MTEGNNAAGPDVTVAEMVPFGGERMWVGLSDGRVIGVPLAWFPRLLRATPAEREAFGISPFGMHWAALDAAPSPRSRRSRSATRAKRLLLL